MPMPPAPVRILLRRRPPDRPPRKIAAGAGTERVGQDTAERFHRGARGQHHPGPVEHRVHAPVPLLGRGGLGAAVVGVDDDLGRDRRLQLEDVDAVALLAELFDGGEHQLRALVAVLVIAVAGSAAAQRINQWFKQEGDVVLAALPPDPLHQRVLVRQGGGGSVGPVPEHQLGAIRAHAA